MKKINFCKINLQTIERLPMHEKRITIPTLFTVVRIILAPFVVLSMSYGLWKHAFVLFVTAALTDYFDGACARAWNQKTFLGACLDPIADKILILFCFTALAFVPTPFFYIPSWFVLLILGKEIVQIIGAIIIYSIKGYFDVRPTLLGKTTTLVQMCFISWLFACYFSAWAPIKICYTLFGVIVVLISMSFIQYIQIGLRYLFMEQ